ncbi:hypothetical protein P3X46_026218 [Hevea brasiliensis]|uniref:ditrans,polycis-polyprenyl diphosphate synthase [(2E,6E)-farnesyldiphosphate specific] n=1 Tax=Hevea brasiliensis TaxID=3981 RepID=A0ABQ9KVX5_HEVBR|nr:uncharacterized protein LOC110649060 isoform X1 [Hevea brasiliensis]KAJ9152675.1 hypothetical protein P3X46_026218 [Hevea brasiliensis]
MDLKPGAGGQRVNRFVDPFAQISYHFLQFLWRTLHLLVSLWYLQVSMVQMIEGFLISSGLVKRYGALDIDKVRYLAIVVDSEEAYQISKVIQLLKWVEDMGVKHLCLYDSKGVLKTNKKTIMESLNNAMPFEEAVEKDVLLDQKQMTVEFASSSDGKEAITRAANVLFMKYLKYAKTGVGKEEPCFTEDQMDEALKAIGYKGPEPDLLLIYGPVRCHLGFSPWRLRYTEMVHMGPLRYMNLGSLKKAIHRFTTVQQNYGT